MGADVAPDRYEAPKGFSLLIQHKYGTAPNASPQLRVRSGRDPGGIPACLSPDHPFIRTSVRIVYTATGSFD